MRDEASIRLESMRPIWDFLRQIEQSASLCKPPAPEALVQMDPRPIHVPAIKPDQSDLAIHRCCGLEPLSFLPWQHHAGCCCNADLQFASRQSCQADSVP